MVANDDYCFVPERVAPCASRNVLLVVVPKNVLFMLKIHPRQQTTKPVIVYNLIPLSVEIWHQCQLRRSQNYIRVKMLKSARKLMEPNIRRPQRFLREFPIPIRRIRLGRNMTGYLVAWMGQKKSQNPLM